MDYELDYSHPILRKHKITGCWINGSGFNLALKQMADVRDFSVKSGDFVFPSASSTLCHQNVAGTKLEIGTKRITILAGYSNITGAQEGSIFKTEYAADSDDRIYLYISDYWNSIRCGISSGAAVKYIDYIDPEVRDGNSHTCGVRRISDGELQLMFDGDLKGTTGVSLYSYVNVDNLYIGNTGGLAFNFDGNIDFLYLFDTNLSDSEYKSLSDNPKQILKRTSANDSVYAALYPVSTNTGNATGTASGTLQAITGNSSGTTTAPDFTASAAGYLSVIKGNVSATSLPPDFTADAAGQLIAITGAGTGATLKPDFSAIGAGVLASITGNASGLVDNPGNSGTAAGVLSAIVGAGSGTSTKPDFSGSGAGVLGAITGSASATVNNPGVSGVGAGYLATITGNASGNTANNSDAIGTGAGVLAAITGNSSGLITKPDFSAVGSGLLATIIGNATNIILGNTNLQFTWAIQQKQMNFTQRDRSLNLYD